MLLGVDRCPNLKPDFDVVAVGILEEDVGLTSNKFPQADDLASRGLNRFYRVVNITGVC